MLRFMIRPASCILFAALAVSTPRGASAVNFAAATVAQARYTVCRVNVRDERLRIFYADTRGDRFETFAALRADLARRGETLTFAMNAGMFHPGFRPVGLLVIDRQTIAPINRAPGIGNFFLQPNGVFLLDARGARVLATDEYRDLTPDFATQSGPMLLHHGEIPDTQAFSATSRSRHIRNGVCAPTPAAVVFAISEDEVTLREFARFFATLGCADALYLDGSISSLYAPQLTRADDREKLGPMIGVAK
jgi:uncharacterized protein YigE (DUF2233 family)